MYLFRSTTFLPPWAVTGSWFIAVPFLQSHKGLETDCVLNFDLDTLFLGSVVPLLEEITSKYKTGIFGGSERENRDKWMKQMNLKEVVNTPLYFNTGLMCYKADCSGLYDKFIRTLEQHCNFMYFPEQDFVNLHFKKKYPLANEFNAIWFNPTEGAI